MKMFLKAMMLLFIGLNSPMWIEVGFAGEIPPTVSENLKTYEKPFSEKDPVLFPSQTVEMDQTTPMPPPVMDPEIVITPDISHDPDAVVPPPIVDHEMILDPVTRKPVSKDQIEDGETLIQPDGNPKKKFRDHQNQEN